METESKELSSDLPLELSTLTVCVNYIIVSI